jgi:dihydroorotase
MPELLQQVRLLDPVSQTDRTADVLVDAGIVQAIAESIPNPPDGAIVRDCQGLILAPGLVDCYSHSGEPGYESRETLMSLAAAAAAGGFTRVAVLPNTAPPLDNPAGIAWFIDQMKAVRRESGVRLRRERSAFDLSSSRRAERRQTLEETADDLSPTPHSPLPTPLLVPWAALTQDVQGQQMTELAELAMTGAVGLGDGKPIANLLLLRRILEYAQPLGKPILLWACDRELSGNGVMREGQDSMLFGLPGVPAIAETTALAAVLECVAETGTPVHCMRISTARSVDLIRAAKARGLPVTASTTWHHLLLNTGHVQSYDPSLRLNPPLGTAHDQTGLCQAVQEGILDAIAIDHSPYTYEEKTVAFAEAPNGAIGLELALPLLWQAFVETQAWTALELWAALSTRPAQCLYQAPPTVAVGQKAEMVLFDPQQSWTVAPRSLRSRSVNTAWLGQKIHGKVRKIWC